MSVTFKVGDTVKNLNKESCYYGRCGEVTDINHARPSRLEVSVKWDGRTTSERYSYMHENFQIIKPKERVVMPTEEQIKAAAESSPEAEAALKKLFPDVEWPRKPLYYGSGVPREPLYGQYLSDSVEHYCPTNYCKISYDRSHLIMDPDYDWELKDGRLYAYKKDS